MWGEVVLAEGTHLGQGQEVEEGMHVLQEAGNPLGKRALSAGPAIPQGPKFLYENLE